MREENKRQIKGGPHVSSLAAPEFSQWSTDSNAFTSAPPPPRLSPSRRTPPYPCRCSPAETLAVAPPDGRGLVPPSSPASHGALAPPGGCGEARAPPVRTFCVGKLREGKKKKKKHPGDVSTCVLLLPHALQVVLGGACVRHVRERVPLTFSLFVLCVKKIQDRKNPSGTAV